MRVPMPDRTDPTVPPVVVAVNPGDPEPSYAGPNRRSGNGANRSRADVNVNLPGGSDEPAWQRDWPRWAKLLWHLGPFSLICGAMIVGGGCFMRERSTDRANDRADRMEEREIRRAEAAQYQRHNDLVSAKFDALVSKIDAAMERSTAGRLAIERLGKELEDALERLFAELKKLAPRKQPKADPSPDLLGFVNPIWWLADHAPPKVMPGEAPAALAPPPRPCETSSSGGAR